MGPAFGGGGGHPVALLEGAVHRDVAQLVAEAVESEGAGFRGWGEGVLGGRGEEETVVAVGEEAAGLAGAQVTEARIVFGMSVKPKWLR